MAGCRPVPIELVANALCGSPLNNGLPTAFLNIHDVNVVATGFEADDGWLVVAAHGY